MKLKNFDRGVCNRERGHRIIVASWKAFFVYTVRELDMNRCDHRERLMDWVVKKFVLEQEKCKLNRKRLKDRKLDFLLNYECLFLT